MGILRRGIPPVSYHNSIWYDAGWRPVRYRRMLVQFSTCRKYIPVKDQWDAGSLRLMTPVEAVKEISSHLYNRSLIVSALVWFKPDILRLPSLLSAIPAL
jgi:hypothetical protein